MKRFTSIVLMGFLALHGNISAGDADSTKNQLPPRVFVIGDTVPVAVVSRKTRREIAFTKIEPDKNGDAVVFPGEKHEFKMRIIGANTEILRNKLYEVYSPKDYLVVLREDYIRCKITVHDSGKIHMLYSDAPFTIASIVENIQDISSVTIQYIDWSGKIVIQEPSLELLKNLKWSPSCVISVVRKKADK